MRPPGTSTSLRQPQFIAKAEQLSGYLKTLSPTHIESVMKVSPALADKTHMLLKSWVARPGRCAIDSFLGDIYSGLQISSWTTDDRSYADEHLRILSGLYGMLRPLDGIHPYRLEMGYRLPAEQYRNVYDFWGDTIAKAIPDNETVVNLTAAEYSKVLGKAWQSRLITPRFLTVSPKTGQPTFVVVHAKIARGAYASWLIRKRVDSVAEITKFVDLGYRYDDALSTPLEPVFVCRAFGGLGLSVRLS